MTDLLLDLLGAIEDENWNYYLDVSPSTRHDYDYMIYARLFHDADEDVSFELGNVMELAPEFEDLSVSVYSDDEGPISVSEENVEDVRQHLVMFRVKE